MLMVFITVENLRSQRCAITGLTWRDRIRRNKQNKENKTWRWDDKGGNFGECYSLHLTISSRRSDSWSPYSIAPLENSSPVEKSEGSTHQGARATYDLISTPKKKKIDTNQERASFTCGGAALRNSGCSCLRIYSRPGAVWRCLGFYLRKWAMWFSWAISGSSNGRQRSEW